MRSVKCSWPLRHGLLTHSVSWKALIIHSIFQKYEDQAAGIVEALEAFNDNSEEVASVAETLILSHLTTLLDVVAD